MKSKKRGLTFVLIIHTEEFPIIWSHHLLNVLWWEPIFKMNKSNVKLVVSIINKLPVIYDLAGVVGVKII